MPGLKDIRVRIDSTKNTQQITRAMKLVSAAKLRKAQHQIVNMRPYANSILKVISRLVATERIAHPLLTPHPDVKRLLLVVLTSDRGLCGSFNSSIIRYVDQFLATERSKFESVDFFFIGRRAADSFAKKGAKVLDSMTRLDRDISYSLASSVADRAMKLYQGGQYDEVRLVYNEFKSAISQKVVVQSLLPVDLSVASVGESDNGSFSNDMIFEPSPEVIIDQLLTKHFTVQVYRCMAESIASEHGARMTAMENATNNAKELVSKLTLTYNKLRQEKITTELTEIVSGAEAL